MTSKRRDQLNRWLLSAIRNERAGRALELLESGAAVDATSSEGESALNLAVEYGLNELIEPLLSRGADPNAAGRFGCPLHLIAGTSLEEGVEPAAVLLRNGARLDVRDPEGATPMFLAARAGNSRLVDLFKQNGAEISETNGELDTALTFAACWGYTDQARMLLDRGIDLHARDNLGMNALAWAAKDGHADTVALLLSRGANPNVGDMWERTPLMRAAEHGSLACVRLLLDAGADPTAKSDSGETALDAARRYSGRNLEEAMRQDWVSMPELGGNEPVPVTVRRETKPSGEVAILVGQWDANDCGSYRELCDAFDGVVHLLESKLLAHAPER